MIPTDPNSFLARLLDAPGPSGFELPAARVWRSEAETIADRLDLDTAGNSIAWLNPEGSPRVMLAGHVDEIGLIVTHITDEGFLYIDGIGGWDSQVLVGQRVKLQGTKGEVMGVIGKKPIHLMKPDEREKVSKMTDLWIDVGVDGREAVKQLGLRVGDPGVLDARMLRVGEDRIVSRAIDNRIGAFVVLEALRLLAQREPRPGAAVAAVATTQEEIAYHGGGARTTAHRIRPDIALVVDVTFSSDAPQIDRTLVGEHKLGGGPVLSRGSAIHPLVFDRLTEVAEANDIAYTLHASARATHTDADAIYPSRDGVATAVVSVPNRYMHSPNEMVALSDLESAARLLVEFIASLDAGADFTPR